jgi:hypothetical protein
MGLLTAVTACGGSGSAAPDAAAPDASAPDGTPSDAGVADHVTGGIFDQLGSAVVGATVCVLHHADIPCATTDAAGNYTMTLPNLQGVDIAVTVTAQGSLSHLATIEEPIDQDGLHIVVWPSGILLLSDAAATQLLATEAGFTFPSTSTGFLRVRIGGLSAGSLTGATATLSPLSGAGPVYGDMQGHAQPSLTGTSSSGETLFGNLTPGVYEVTALAAGKTCKPGIGGLLIGDWPPIGAGTVRVEVVANLLTDQVYVDCF